MEQLEKVYNVLSIEDVIVLINKQQEKIKELELEKATKLMTLEEIYAYKSVNVWIEFNAMLPRMRLVKIVPLGYDACMVYLHDSNPTIFSTKQYGTEWRCWTSRPTDEQRKAVKWNMTPIEKIISALENCIAEEKCRDCPWEECEHEHKTVELPFGLVMDILAILRFKVLLARSDGSDDKVVRVKFERLRSALKSKIRQEVKCLLLFYLFLL